MKNIFLALSLASALCGGTISYNALLGTLPTAQGFTLIDTTVGAPAPTVAFGRLRQGPTPASGTQFWYASGLGLNFAAGDSVELEGRFRILNSPLLQAGPGAGYRTGWGVSISDIFGNTIPLNLADGLAILAREYDPVLGGTLQVPCDCEQFHTFRLVANGVTATLSLDGINVGSVAVLLNASSLSPYTDGFLFGDPTNTLGNQSEVEYITVRSTAAPEPTTMGMLAIAAASFLVWRRRA